MSHKPISGLLGIDTDMLLERLNEYTPIVHPVDMRRHASVALILEPSAAGHSVLFIERSHRNNDPWSGQMAFPGGRREPFDADEQAVAERETLEEIGIELGSSSFIGRLDDMKGRHGGTSEGMVISCFVYELQSSAQPVLNHEVAAVARLPLSHLVDENNRVVVKWREATERHFPGIRFSADDSRVVWGLTYRFLREFLLRLGHELPAGG